MLQKKKYCAGFDGISHLGYIYKNINGEKYCKSCALKLEKPKSIRKVSDNQVFKIILKRKLIQEDIEFYKNIWYKRFGRVGGTAEKYEVEIDNVQIIPRCECCSKRLFWEPNLMYFHHIMEKRNFPQFRHLYENIAIVCPQCHSKYETNPDTVPYLQKRRKELINKFIGV